MVWGLPRLTIEEFAREVQDTPERISVWLAQLLHRKAISAAQHSKWTNDTEPISEAVVRLYLAMRLGHVVPVKPPAAKKRHKEKAAG